MNIKKLYGIMPALMTAFDGDKIDTKSVSALVKKLAADKVHGLYVGGSSGEMVLCSLEERKALLETVMENKGIGGAPRHATVHWWRSRTTPRGVEALFCGFTRKLSQCIISCTDRKAFKESMRDRS